MKIQELEARLVDSESENVNLNFQVRELKAFLEEKTNLLELYNSKGEYATSFPFKISDHFTLNLHLYCRCFISDAKSEKLLLNNLKEKDLIQIIRNVLVCMKKGRGMFFRTLC